MKLSIVIPCYNEKQTIKNILETVRKVPFKDKEIIVVDDYSADGTRELLQTPAFKKLYDRLVLHEKTKEKEPHLEPDFNRRRAI